MVKMILTQSGCIRADKVVGFQINSNILSVSVEGGQSAKIAEYNRRHFDVDGEQALCAAAGHWFQEFMQSEQHMGLLNALTLAPVYAKVSKVIEPVQKLSTQMDELLQSYRHEDVSQMLGNSIKQMQEGKALLSEEQKPANLELKCMKMSKQLEQGQNQWEQWQQEHLETQQPEARRRIGMKY